MSEQPKVSVIVPVYNADKYLDKTISSLLAQTLEELEIICVNDGSTDNSDAILRRFADGHSKIKVIEQTNGGAFRARMRGIRESNGDYIAFCDADDYPKPTLYEKLYNLAEESKSEIAVCSYERISPRGTSSKEMTAFGNQTLSSIDDKGWMVSINTALWNKLFQQSLFSGCNEPHNPPRIMEDAYLFYSVMDKINHVTFTDEPLYIYKEHEGSAMSHFNSSEICELYSAWQDLRNKNNEALVDLGAFVHLGVSMSLLLIRAGHNKEAQNALKGLPLFFSTLSNNPYLRIDYLREHPELLTVKIAYLVYKMRMLVPAMSLYSKAERYFGHAIKW